MEILLVITGVVIGVIGGWVIAKLKFSSVANVGMADLKIAQGKADGLEKDVVELKNELTKEREQVIELKSTLSTTEADYRNLQEKLQEQKQELADLQDKFKVEFKNLANEIFEEKSKKFTDQNKTNIGELLNPLREKITEFEKKVDQSNKDNLQHNSALREQLKHLKELNQQITKEAENLTKALKGETKTQGNWGEFILESILEKSGLQKGREYEVQTSVTTEDGKRYQPDVVIKLPDDKNIIVDSKVTLVAYERFVSEDDELSKEQQLKMHIQSVRKHVKDLSEKSYQNLYGIDGLDFVLMFIPIEPAFSLAVQNDTELFTDAYEKNIVIVSPSTLIATLRTISNIWKNEYQNRNALEIARQGGALYDKFVAFSEDLIKVGKSLNATQSSYKDAMNKLVEGKGNLVNRAENIRKLGAKTSKGFDPKLIDRSSEDQE